MKIVVKICGLTCAEDALFAEELGATALGFVFYPKSPRYIDPLEAAHISSQLKPHIVRVGVFVDESPDTVLDIAKKARLTAIQLHGSEDQTYIDKLGNIRIIKALRIGADFDAAVFGRYKVGTFLLDAFSADAYGGTGKTFDWNVVRDVSQHRRILLAGGLTPSNVRQAVDTVRPWGVDVSSGVESAPGLKDHEKLRAFFHALNGYC